MNHYRHPGDVASKCGHSLQSQPRGCKVMLLRYVAVLCTWGAHNDPEKWQVRSKTLPSQSLHSLPSFSPLFPHQAGGHAPLVALLRSPLAASSAAVAIAAARTVLSIAWRNKDTQKLLVEACAPPLHPLHCCFCLFLLSQDLIDLGARWMVRRRPAWWKPSLNSCAPRLPYQRLL